MWHEECQRQHEPAEPGEVATEQRATLATWAAGALTPVAQLDHP